MPRPIAVLLLIFCTILWGFAFVAQKSAMQAIGPLTFSAVRYFLGALLVTPLAFIECRRQRGKGIIITRRQWLGIFILSLAFFFAVWLQQEAMRTATVTNGGFLTSLYVIITPAIVYFTARVHPHPIVYLGAPLALAGIYLLTGADLRLLTAGDLLLIACAFCWAVQVAVLGPLAKETGMPITISTMTFYAVAILSALSAPFLENPNFSAIRSCWMEITYTGVLSTAVAFTLQAIGQQYVPPSNAAIILSTEALFAAFGGALLLHERLAPVSYFGAALIFLAIILVELVPILQKRKSA